MSFDMRWRIHIKNLETYVCIGIHAHERVPQRLYVNAVIEGDYPFRPASIADCFNYDHIHRLVVQEWPKRPHTDLLETYTLELLEHIFRIDGRVTLAKVSLSKPDIFSEADSVGVEAEWTRADFERFTS